METRKNFGKNKKRFGGKKDRREIIAEKQKEEKKKKREAEAREKKRVKEMHERYKTLTPSYQVFEPFECPSEIEFVFYAKHPVRYRSSEGKIHTFRKGQMVLRHKGGIVSVLDGRYGKELD